MNGLEIVNRNKTRIESTAKKISFDFQSDRIVLRETEVFFGSSYSFT